MIFLLPLCEGDMRKTMRKIQVLLDMKTQGLDGAIVISIAQQCKRGRWNEFCIRKVARGA
jgi:hypothetical protein